MFISRLDDSGIELAFWYEAISRRQSAYVFGKPFDSLTAAELSALHATFGSLSKAGNFDKLVVEPLRQIADKDDTPDGLVRRPPTLTVPLDARMRDPELNFRNGGNWSDTFAFAFNIRRPISGVIQELEVFLSHYCEEQNLKITPPEGDHRKYRLFEAWDVFRWHHDNPKSGALGSFYDCYKSSISALANLRKTIDRKLTCVLEGETQQPPPAC